MNSCLLGTLLLITSHILGRTCALGGDALDDVPYNDRHLAMMDAMLERHGHSASSMSIYESMKEERGFHDGPEIDRRFSSPIEPTPASALTRRTRRLGRGGGTETICEEGVPISGTTIVGAVRVVAGVYCEILADVTIEGNIIMEDDGSSLVVGTWGHLTYGGPVHVTGDIIVNGANNAPSFLNYTSVSYSEGSILETSWKVTVDGKISIKDSSFDYISISGHVGDSVDIEKSVVHTSIWVWHPSIQKQLKLKEFTAPAQAEIHLTDSSVSPDLKIERNCLFPNLYINVASAGKVEIKDIDPASVDLLFRIWGEVEFVYFVDHEWSGYVFTVLEEHAYITGDFVVEEVTSPAFHLTSLQFNYDQQPTCRRVDYISKLQILWCLPKFQFHRRHNCMGTLQSHCR